jgi:hypothetical protein
MPTVTIPRMVAVFGVRPRQEAPVYRASQLGRRSPAWPTVGSTYQLGLRGFAWPTVAGT